ncbi:MAG: YdeI/OmpD-associated family protein [Phycisphaerae bacterium]|nr:YdeI/OmpD-associated family protein [Phycisphaerae bacterium]
MRDFIHWITSAKQAETRVKGIATACDPGSPGFAKGRRRRCCLDCSGLYDDWLSCSACW